MRDSRLCAFLGMFALIPVSLSLLAQKPEPPMRGIHCARGHQPQAAQANPDMTWHGGNILTTTQTAAIFWGTNWGNPSFVSDKITGLDSWYNGVGGSTYGATSDEYTGPYDTLVGVTISYLEHIILLTFTHT